jgi:transposase
MPGSTPHYPPEFKREAVELYRSSDRSIQKVADELGVSSWSLGRWIKQHEIDSGEQEGLSTSERGELSRPRRENRVVVLLVLLRYPNGHDGKRNSPHPQLPTLS